jgi:peptide/nickel transport system permease protein
MAQAKVSFPRSTSEQPGNDLWRRAFKKFLRNKTAVISTIILALMIVLTAFAPYIAPHDPNKLDFFNQLATPSAEYWLGTDEVGRDVFSRLLHGGRVSLLVGFVSATLSVIIGILIGGIAGYFSGIPDAVLMRITDGMLSIPIFFFMLIIMAIFGSGLTQIVIVIGVTSWMPIARVVRGEVMQVKEFPYTEAAVALGAHAHHVIWKHLIPQTIPSVIVAATLGVANAILLESALSYLGLGIQPPTASWGNMLQAAQSYIWSQPLLALWPGLLIFLAVMAFNSFGDGIRDVFDPADK